MLGLPQSFLMHELLNT